VRIFSRQSLLARSRREIQMPLFTRSPLKKRESKSRPRFPCSGWSADPRLSMLRRFAKAMRIAVEDLLAEKKLAVELAGQSALIALSAPITKTGVGFPPPANNLTTSPVIP
jgi:hypothetical protein